MPGMIKIKKPDGTTIELPVRKSNAQPNDGTFDNRPWQSLEVRDTEAVKKRAQQMRQTFRTDKLYRDNEEMWPLSDDEILINVVADPNATAKCCRAAFVYARKPLADIFRVFGEGIEIMYSTDSGSFAEGIPPDPPWGWDMTKPEEGFPCINLTADGKCGVHDHKPYRCGLWPESPTGMERMPTCSISFDEQGNRTGVCDGCGSLVE